MQLPSFRSAPLSICGVDLLEIHVGFKEKNIRMTEVLLPLLKVMLWLSQKARKNLFFFLVPVVFVQLTLPYPYPLNAFRLS